MTQDTTMTNALKLLLAAVTLLALFQTVAAIDLNSTYALRYFPSNQLQFQVDPQGNVDVYGNLDLQATRLNNVSNFFDTNACPAGAFISRVYENGSYDCRSASTLDTDDQNLSEVLVQGNVANMSIDLANHNVSNVRSLTNFFDPVCPADQVINQVYDNGSYSCISVDSASSAEDLNETLSVGNSAGLYNIDMNNNNITNIRELQSYFAGQCPAGQAVTQVYPDGSYECTDVNTLANVENLADTLAAGNFSDGQDIFLNGSSAIRFADGVRIGDGSTSASGSRSLAIGKRASADFDDGIAIGRDADAGWTNVTIIGPRSSANNFASVVIGGYSSAVGQGSVVGFNASAENEEAVVLGAHGVAGNIGAMALGTNSQASDMRSIAVGYGATASANGAAAIGYNSQAPNTYEATFGNLAGQELDVNITGNTTIHGTGGLTILNGPLDMNTNTIQNIGDLQGTGIVDSVNILNGGVGTVDLAGQAVSADKLGFDSVNESHITSSALGLGITGGSGTPLNIGAHTALTRNGSGLSVNTNLVPFKNQQESVSAGQWIFENNLTVQGNLDVWGNITNTQVSNLSINGSLLPPSGYNNMFDVGSSARQWNDAFFGGTLTVSSGGDVVFPNSVIDNNELVNDAVTVNANGPLSGGGSVTLGSSIGIGLPDIYVNETGDTMTGDLSFSGANLLMGSNQIRYTGGIEIGDSATYTANGDDIAIGQNAFAADISGEDSWDNAIAIGDQANASRRDAISIGDLTAASGTNTVVVGSEAAASGSDAVALGASSESSGTRSITLGYGAGASSAEGDYAIVIGAYQSSAPIATGQNGISIGRETVSTADNAIAIGGNADASATGAIAFGDQAQAPNAYEATFGNLAGQELDVNVTGDATVHGTGGLNLLNGDLNMNGNSITNFFASACTGGQVVSRVWANGSYQCVDPSEDLGVENLADTLAAGNFADGQDIFMNGSSAIRFENGIAIGNGSTETGVSDSIAIGRGAFYYGQKSIALGEGARADGAASGGLIAIGANAETTVGIVDAVALGRAAQASASGAVAIGVNSEAPNADEATFGNLNGNELSVNVTGNTTIHGTGGLTVLNGDIDASNNNVNDVASIDGGGNAIRVDDDIDTNGNSITSSGGEICIGDQCS